MGSQTTEQNSTAILSAEYWTIGRWFGFIVLLLLIWAGVYLAAHSTYGVQGYEYTHFSTQQIRQINHILAEDNSVIPITLSAKSLPPGALIDSASSMSSGISEIDNFTNSGCDMPCRADKVILYISSEFDNSVMPSELLAIKRYATTFSQQDIGIFLSDYKLKIRSYFWLSGPLIYAELIFWVTFGVMCSLLFSIATLLNGRTRNSFNNKLIMSQVAKLFYAPFIAIVLLLVYNYFKQYNTLSSNLGQGIIIFSFFTGLLAGRLMNFLDRLKKLVLPGAGIADTQQDIINNRKKSLPTTKDADDIEMADTASQPQYAVDKNGELNADIRKKRDDGELIDVDIEVKLDNSGIFDDERNDITNKGFDKAIVTLHNINGKDIIPAKKAIGSNTIFTATNVKPGIYIARATLSLKLQDEQIINLFGERTSYLTADKPGFELYIRKYEMVD